MPTRKQLKMLRQMEECIKNSGTDPVNENPLTWEDSVSSPPLPGEAGEDWQRLVHPFVQ